MEKKAQNATTNYAPEKVTEKVEITFTKIVSPGKTTISGQISKNAANVGSVSYESTGDYLITSLKPCSALDADEMKAIHEAVPGCISEMLAD